MNPAPYLAICIPTYNRSQYLQKCLASVIAEIDEYSLHSEVAVYISDNDSSDNTAETVQSIIQSTGVVIHYAKNKINIGAVNNFIQLTETAVAEYIYILGDDDEIVKGSLVKVLSLIKENSDAIVQHYKCVQTDFIQPGMPSEKLNLFNAAEKYFYSIGNAGTFILKANEAKDVVKKHKQRLALTCWPQTEIMFSILAKIPAVKSFLASSVELVISENHGENVTYNSWYILETFCFSLLRIAQNVANDNQQPAFETAAKKSIPACKDAVKFFFRFLLFATYYDYSYELAKTKELIKENKRYLKGSNRFYPVMYGFLLSLPRWLKKLLVAFYFLVSNKSFKKSKFDKSYADVKAYQQRKYEVYKQKGKLTEDNERYIY